MRVYQIIAKRQHGMCSMHHHGRNPRIISHRTLMPPAIIEYAVAKLFNQSAVPKQETQRPVHVLYGKRTVKSPHNL